MRTAYKIILHPEKKGYTVFIPDFNIGTQGSDIAESIYMARDAIGLTGITTEDLGNPIPLPGTAEYVLEKNDLETYVDIDFAEYRKKHALKKIKKTLTISSWLNEAAEQENINFSQTLEEALKQKLHLEQS